MLCHVISWVQLLILQRYEFANKRIVVDIAPIFTYTEL